jgi:hypothetical protein
MNCILAIDEYIAINNTVYLRSNTEGSARVAFLELREWQQNPLRRRVVDDLASHFSRGVGLERLLYYFSKQREDALPTIRKSLIVKIREIISSL